MEIAAAPGMVGSSDDQQLEEVMLGTMSPAGSAVSAAGSEDDEGDLRRGPWTVEEDVLLVNYIASHGEGRWNSLARSAGLKRTGKSCRLRWLNYLRPDVRRGNITAEEQLLILELHSRWGNRWSKIAQHLPGRTDNEIKNYWRTRVQKHARQLRCDVNSKQFRDVVRYVWMPRLVERIQAGESSAAAAAADDHDKTTATASAPAACQMSAYGGGGAPANNDAHQEYLVDCYSEPGQTTAAAMSPEDASSAVRSSLTTEANNPLASTTTTPSNGQCGGTTAEPVDSEDMMAQAEDVFGGSWSDLLAATGRDDTMPGFEFGDFEDNLWSLEDLCLHHQQCS